MPDNNQSNVPGDGEGAGNSAAGQQAGSSPSIDAAEIFNALRDYNEFQQYVASTAQSKHDKRIGQIEKSVKSLAEQMAEVDKLEQAGLPRDFAIQWMEMREAQVQPNVQQTAEVVDPEPTSQVGKGGQDTVLSVAQGLGLDPNSAKVIEIARQGGSQAEQLQKLTSLWQEQNAPVQANQGAVMPTSQGQTATADLATQYEKERAELGFGKPFEFQQLKDKYRKLGLNIL